MTRQVSAEKEVVTTARLPGWIGRIIILSTLICAVLVRSAGSLDDPPPPLDDPAIRNLLSLSLCFAAGLTAWLWFCFRSGYPRRLRLAVAAGTALAMVALAGVIVAMGWTRVIQFSGSLVPRLAGDEHDPAMFASEPASGKADFQATTEEDFPQFLGPERRGWIGEPSIARDWKSRAPRQV